MRFTLLTTALLAVAPASSATAACDQSRALKVLFVGNSFTYVGNVPHQVAAIANSLPGPCIETAMIAIGGAMLEDHWKSDTTVRRIATGDWTHVVMNDQSSFGESWFLEGKPRLGTSGRELETYGARFAKAIRDAGATPVFIAHWADAKRPARDQQVLDYHVSRVAKAGGARVAPAGRAIRRLEASGAAIDPFHADRHHLSPAGAYLEALVIYATLTGRSPVGAPRRIEGPAVELQVGTVRPDSIVPLVDLGEADATRLQRIAAAAWTATRGEPFQVAIPAPLDLPAPPRSGDPVSLERLAGAWRGNTMALPHPGGDSATVDLSLGPPGQDSLQLRAGPIEMAGPVTVTLDGTRIVIRSSVMPRGDRAPRRARPLDVTVEVVLRGGVMTGVMTIRQRFEETMGTFDAIGRVSARRVTPER